MITDVQICSRTVILGVISKTITRLSESDWSLISIHGSKIDSPIKGENQDKLRELGCHHTHSSLFSDVTLERYNLNLNRDPQVKDQLILFNKKLAKKIIHFINRINSLKTDNTLVIHCEMGISRSAAVGIFACGYLGLNVVSFIKKNPHIRPNKYVLKTLIRA